MSSCVEKISHSCGSGDGMQVFHSDDEGYTAYCFACDTYVSNPYEGDVSPGFFNPDDPTLDDGKDKVDSISMLPSRNLPTRALRADCLAYFGVKVEVSEQDGVTPVVRYFPYRKDAEIVGYKAKLMEHKKMWSVGDTRGNIEMFGWQEALVAGGKKLFITEGEEDAVALFQALKDKQAGTQWSEYDPAVVSLSKGSGSVKTDLTRHSTEIKAHFKEVILVFDRDDAGEAAVRSAMDVIPDARTITLAFKDANQYVIEGHSKALATACLFNAAPPKNTRVINAFDLYEIGRTQAEMGLSYPWPQLTKITRGMRFGETYYLGAGVKMGKTTARCAIATHLMKEHKLPVFMAAPEEANSHTKKLMAGQWVGQIFHDPEIPFNYPEYDRAQEEMGHMLHLVDGYQQLGWENLRQDIVYAAHQGARAVFIDPITNLTNEFSAAEANTKLQGIAQDLAVMALDMDLIIFMFCHLKAPLAGEVHERGGKVMSAQFAGSRAMMRSCHMMLGLEGNKDPDLPIGIRNQRELIVLEDRMFGASGKIKIFYKEASGIYKQMEK